MESGGRFSEAMRLDSDPAGWDDAEICYRKALALDPGLAAAHTNLGQLSYRRGDTRAARDAFGGATRQLALDSARPWFATGAGGTWAARRPGGPRGT